MKYEKLSAPLAVLMFEYENFKGEDFLSVQPSRPQSLTISENGMPQTTIFIYCEENASFENIAELQVNSLKGKIRTAQIELKKISELSEMATVQHISVSMRLKPSNDFDALETTIGEIKTHHPELMAKDLIIGIIDTGINVDQNAFANRIHSIWDQELSGKGFGTFNYGKTLTDGTFQESADEDGNGTQTAKIFNKYVAPDTKFVIVKTDFQTAHIADGIRYVLDAAEKERKTAIIILNLDGKFHTDETDDLSAFIKQETESGKLIVTTKPINKIKGNHFTAIIEANIYLPKRIKIKVPPNTRFGSPTQFVLFGSFEDFGDCEITIMAPNGMASKSAKPGSSENPTRHSNYQTSEAFLTVPIISSLNHGRKEFYIDLRPVAPKHLISGGVWQLTIKNVGKTAVNVNLVSWVPEKPKDVKFI